MVLGFFCCNAPRTMNVHAKVLEILSAFGLKDKKAAEFMGLSQSQYANKKNERNYNRFKQEDLYALIAHLKALADKLP